jgi:hypothetical protein
MIVVVFLAARYLHSRLIMPCSIPALIRRFLKEVGGLFGPQPLCNQIFIVSLVRKPKPEFVCHQNTAMNN